MELFGLKLGKKKTNEGQQNGIKKSPKTDLKRHLNQYANLALRHESSIIALAVAALLALTSLRMLQYMDPQVDDAKVQESISKSKKVKIDPETVQRLNSLQDSGTTTSPQLEPSQRTNPFSE